MLIIGKIFTILAFTAIFLGQCDAVDSGSSGSVNSPFQPPQPIQPQAPYRYETTLALLREQYQGDLDLVRIDPADYDRTSNHWPTFLAKANGRHAVVQDAQGRLFAMDRAPLGDAAILLKTRYAVPSNHLYRIWRVKGVHEQGKREFVDLAFMRNERDFKWKLFNDNRLYTFQDLTGAIRFV